VLNAGYGSGILRLPPAYVLSVVERTSIKWYQEIFRKYAEGVTGLKPRVKRVRVQRGWSGAARASSAMKLVARWAQVAPSEARICQVRAPFGVLLPQEILRAITAGRSWRSAMIIQLRSLRPGEDEALWLRGWL